MALPGGGKGDLLRGRLHRRPGGAGSLPGRAERPQRRGGEPDDDLLLQGEESHVARPIAHGFRPPVRHAPESRRGNRGVRRKCVRQQEVEASRAVLRRPLRSRRQTGERGVLLLRQADGEADRADPGVSADGREGEQASTDGMSDREPVSVAQIGLASGSVIIIRPTGTNETATAETVQRELQDIDRSHSRLSSTVATMRSLTPSESGYMNADGDSISHASL